ncbi:MAG: hypothetical protein IJ274_05935, partial [Lachnospiraceae bacterium]|nr:hypothetical protein [Lachnospiraceae bacterium]
MRKELQSVRKALYALVGIQFLCNFVLGAPMKYLESAALVGFDMAIGGSLALIMLLAVLTFVFAGAKRGALKLKMLRVIYIGYGIGIFLCFWCQIRTAKLLKEGLVYVKRFINRGIGGKALSRHGLNSLAALEKINVLVVICEFVLLGMMLWVLWKEMGELNIRKPVRGKMDINSDRVILLCNRCKADENRKLRIKRTEYGIFTEAEFRKKCKKEKLYSQLCKICYVTDCRNEEEFESVLEQIYRENVHDTENSNVNRQILIINVCSGGMTEIPQFYENLLWLRVCYVPDIDWITEHEIMSRLMVREEGWVSEYYANPIKFQNEFAECFEVNPVFADEMIRNFYNGSKASMAVLQSVMAQLDYVELCVRLSMYYYVLKNIGELQGKGEEELKLIKEAFAGGASSRRILPTEL